MAPFFFSLSSVKRDVSTSVRDKPPPGRQRLRRRGFHLCLDASMPTSTPTALTSILPAVVAQAVRDGEMVPKFKIKRDRFWPRKKCPFSCSFRMRHEGSRRWRANRLTQRSPKKKQRRRHIRPTATKKKPTKPPNHAKPQAFKKEVKIKISTNNMANE